MPERRMWPTPGGPDETSRSRYPGVTGGRAGGRLNAPIIPNSMNSQASRARGDTPAWALTPGTLYRIPYGEGTCPDRRMRSAESESKNGAVGRELEARSSEPKGHVPSRPPAREASVRLGAAGQRRLQLQLVGDARQALVEAAPLEAVADAR